jgi:anionic cell wall polymer biosynthesis LytR-Cps2A-Psr (LCP) family protein
MLAYIQSFFKYAVFAFLVNDYFKHNYTEKYNTIITNGGFSLIQLYSKIQILCNKLAASNPLIVNLMNQIFNNAHSSDPDVEFILDGYVNFLVTKEELVKAGVRHCNEIDYDFIIYSNYDKVNKIVNKRIFTKMPCEADFHYSTSDIRFILAEVEINDKTIKVDFKTDNYNYYIVNNIINHKFLEYFLKKYHPREIMDFHEFEKPFQDMKLKILDHNVEKQEFDLKHVLKINKVDYSKIELH